jgi:hypothetical protein
VTALARIPSIVLIEDRVGDVRKGYAMLRSINAAYPALLLRPGPSQLSLASPLPAGCASHGL